MNTYVVVGLGATGSRIVKHLVRDEPEARLVLVDDSPGRAAEVARTCEENTLEIGSALDVTRVPDGSTVVLAGRTGSHPDNAQACLSRGVDVVSVSDSLGDVRELLELDDLARRHEARLVIGAGMMPGLSDVLVAHAATQFDELTEVHVSKFGTGGPDCARQHHAALSRLSFDWRDDGWLRRPGGSGRELAWFPQPVEAADCYRAALADPLLLVRSNPSVQRVTARMAATRRDRLTMHLPMLRPPHPEGLLGAVRVELRGMRSGGYHELILGCAERPAVAASIVAGIMSHSIANRKIDSAQVGAGGVAEWVDPLSFLQQVRRLGLRLEVFAGSDETSASGQIT